MKNYQMNYVISRNHFLEFIIVSESETERMVSRYSLTITDSKIKYIIPTNYSGFCYDCLQMDQMQLLEFPESD